VASPISFIEGLFMSELSVQSLLFEREGYVKRGRMDRVAEVDRQLAFYGIAVSKPSKVERAVAPVEVATVEVEAERAVAKPATRKRKV
jgi:hypothetical protein